MSLSVLKVKKENKKKKLYIYSHSEIDTVFFTTSFACSDTNSNDLRVRIIDILQYVELLSCFENFFNLA